MLPEEMRILITFLALVSLLGVVVVGWIVIREPSPAQVQRIDQVLQPTAPPGEPPAYAHCASCHLHDGSGRPDGVIPRLAGQRRSVLKNKLYRLRAGILRLPVMDPFARTLSPNEIEEIANYLSELPEQSIATGGIAPDDRARGASLYAQHCASCHGANAEGQDGVFASKLCGQYAGYLRRRLDEVVAGVRGDSDAAMRDAIDGVPAADLPVIVAWLAQGKGCAAP